MNNKYHTSITDNDLYKVTLQVAICQMYPRVRARYTFINRDNRPFPEGFAKELKRIIDTFRDYQVTRDEIDFIREKCYYIHPQFLDFFKGFTYNPEEVIISQEGEKLHITVEGPWYRTVLWEVPLMATVSELYFEMTGQKAESEALRRQKVASKIKEIAAIDENPILFSDFGTRRRYSFQNHDIVVQELMESHGFLGTSNLALAMKYNLLPLGTLPHEWFQAHAAMFGFLRGNERALEAWVQVYQGDLGIALPDTFTTDVFYKYAFNTKYAKLFDGVRQDSGNPLAFIDKTLSHYTNLRISPISKVILFSDNIKSADQIREMHGACKNKIGDRYGIGTWFTNDVGVKPLNIVIKLTALDFGYGWVDTVKLSDSPTKHTGQSEAIDLCLKTLKI